jgi:hypothetical protein
LAQRENPSSAVAKNIERYDETGSHEDHHRKGKLFFLVTTWFHMCYFIVFISSLFYNVENKEKPLNE